MSVEPDRPVVEDSGPRDADAKAEQDGALTHEGRQAVRNQGQVEPEDYPDRDLENPA